ncbi:hypothetical protein CMV_003510 [Castanea mollissima]|uniref:Ribonuclease H1 N-terminal domain-containing protein n=1 Tax=Castanea mollissima TaxID=60419 RepID=A0A8J4VW59_9ROSI|nr:hypothetical protein CMV_003510 [Castanea mollissima]
MPKILVMELLEMGTLLFAAKGVEPVKRIVKQPILLTTTLEVANQESNVGMKIGLLSNRAACFLKLHHFNKGRCATTEKKGTTRCNKEEMPTWTKNSAMLKSSYNHCCQEHWIDLEAIQYECKGLDCLVNNLTSQKLSYVMSGMGCTYVVFNDRVPGIYDNWLDASRQVHKFPNANHKSYKDRREAEAACMEYLHCNGMDVQGGASASWVTPNMSNSTPPSTCPSKGTNYDSGDIRNTLLRYQLEVAIEEHDHARRIAILSVTMLNEVVAHAVGDDEVDEPTRQCTGK